MTVYVTAHPLTRPTVHLSRTCHQLKRCADVMALLAQPTDTPVCGHCQARGLPPAVAEALDAHAEALRPEGA